MLGLGVRGALQTRNHNAMIDREIPDGSSFCQGGGDNGWRGSTRNVCVIVETGAWIS